MKNEYKSRVYTDRPAYADFDAPAKFTAIQSIIAKRLKQYPKAICSYSGGSDSDILIDLIERTRILFTLPPVKYVFFNTGLEMKATKDHVKAVAERYEVEIEECRPKIGIVTAARRYGIPFVSKIMSAGLSEWQKKGVPLSIAEEYEQAEDKAGEIVLDPFDGIGSTGYQAVKMGRRHIGVELKKSYFEQAVRNLQAAACKKAVNDNA